jgi:uncharacterized protein (DUF2236 family)
MAAIANVRAIHEHVTGTAPDGRPYAASDTRLLTWVHVAEVRSFLQACEAYGEPHLGQADRDGYVADMALVAAELGCRTRPGPRSRSSPRSAATATPSRQERP